MLYGSITASTWAIGISKIYWLNEVFSSVMNPSDFGATSSDVNMLVVEEKTPSIWWYIFHWWSIREIDGKQHYLWRAVDQDGEVIDVFLQTRRDGKAAIRFFKRLLKTHHREPRKIVTDKLRSYGVAHRELIPDRIHDTSQYANNRAELSHQPTRVRERGMRRFKSMQQAQRFLGVHSAVYNLFNLGRHLVSAKNYRYFRLRAFASWKNAVAI